MRWPLSPNFWRLTSKTGDRGRAQFALPRSGLLTHGRTYYWRVRAQDASGVWGPWSKTFRFTAQGPGQPVEVTMDYDRAANTGTLRWKPNPIGRRAVRYRIYGSNERGFTVSDEPYKVFVGQSRDAGLSSPFPGNFIAETDQTRLVVLGTGAPTADSSRAFYRVVAVDENGKRSGASDFVAAPRPVMHGPTVIPAKAGQRLSYQVPCTRSIGDLRAYMEGGKQVWRFWNIESPRFALEGAPDWLTIDPETGTLAGAPPAPGKYEVTVSAVIDRTVRKLDVGTLAWGRQKIASETTERVGETTAKLVIEATR
jgi:hypothetical protein